MAAYIDFFRNEKFLLWYMIILKSLLIMKELVQVRAIGPYPYICDPWNYLDLAQHICLFPYCVMRLNRSEMDCSQTKVSEFFRQKDEYEGFACIESEQTYERGAELLVVGSLACFMRCGSWLRLFDGPAL